MQSVGNNLLLLHDLSNNIAGTLQSTSVFVGRKLEHGHKQSIVSQHCIIYKFACDLCDVVFVGYIQPNIFIHALLNTHIKLLVNIFQKLMVTKIFLMRVSFAFLRNATENKNVIHQRTLDLALILRENPLVLNTFFNLYNIFLCYISF